MKAATEKYRQLLRYIYAIIAIIVVAAAILMIALYSVDKTQDNTREVIHSYYLRSLTLTASLSQDVRTMENLLHHSVSADNRGSHREVVGEQIEINGLMYSARKKLSQLRELQNRYGAQSTATTLERLVLRFEGTAGRIAPGIAHESMLPDFEMLNLNIEQLDRLLSISIEDTAIEFGVDKNRVLAILSVVLVGMLLLAWYLMRGLRETFVHQAQTEQELEESWQRLQHLQKLDALGQLVGGVAHDFNNLLTPILGHADLLQAKAPDDGEAQSSLDEIRKAAQQAASLTQQLLSFSRRQRIEPRVIDLNELIQTMEPMIRRLIGEDIELTAEYGDNIFAVEMDPGQTEQIIMNLVVNARDAMPGGGRLSIQTSNTRVDPADPRRPDVVEGNYAKLCIADSGVGMDAVTRTRLFEPFFTTKPRGRGTGLGLSTVHGIVAGGKGHIFVDSSPGNGTRFKIYLPQATRQAETSPAHYSPQPAVGGSETILVVDDDESIRILLEAALGARGFQVLTAPDGNAGLEVCRSGSHTIDVIISDVIMPEMNGPEFMQRALRLQPDVVAIYMSGYTDDIVLRGGMEGVEAPFINKPFEIELLVQIISERLAHKRLTSPAPEVAQIDLATESSRR